MTSSDYPACPNCGGGPVVPIPGGVDACRSCARVVRVTTVPAPEVTQRDVHEGHDRDPADPEPDDLSHNRRSDARPDL
jgi:hypothetical protein